MQKRMHWGISSSSSSKVVAFTNEELSSYIHRSLFSGLNLLLAVKHDGTGSSSVLGELDAVKGAQLKHLTPEAIWWVDESGLVGIDGWALPDEISLAGLDELRLVDELP